MRKDFTLSNRATRLPNTSTLGYGLAYAKRGYWIVFEDPGNPGRTLMGRVVGQIQASLEPGGIRKTMIYVLCLGSHQFIMPRWIKPEAVLECQAQVPKDVLRLMALDFTDLKHVKAEIDPTQSYPMELGEKA